MQKTFSASEIEVGHCDVYMRESKNSHLANVPDRRAKQLPTFHMGEQAEMCMIDSWMQSFGGSSSGSVSLESLEFLR